MDHTFSTTGAIRQHHQHQSIRNSLSPSPHNSNTTAHFSTNLYRISPTPITNNILSAAAAISAGNYSQSPTASVSNFYRVPAYTVQQQQQQQQQTQQIHRVDQQQQQQQQQQQYLQQIQQQQACSFTGISAVNASSPQEVSSYSSQGNIRTTRLGVGTGQYPLRPSTTNNSSNIRISPTNQTLSVTSYTPVNTGGQSSYSPQQLVDSNYRNQQQHRSPKVQVRQPQQHQQQYQPQQQQYSNVSLTQHHNNHTHQQQQQSNMNKNRYINQQQQNNLNGIVVSTVQAVASGGSGVENGNTTTANVKELIQQVSQQQQNVNNNANTSSSISTTTASVPPTVKKGSSPTTQGQQVQPPPQYRIFKRGDSIPGISSPIQLTPVAGGNDGAAGGTGTGINNDNETNVGGVVVVGRISDSGTLITTDAQNDKENKTAAANGGAGDSKANNASSTGSRTPLSQIGEIARYHNLHVEYRLVNETGPPHAPTFTVLLRIGTEEFNGQGASIKKAQHAAAEEALEKTTLGKPPPKNKPSRKPFGAAGGSGGGGGVGGGSGGSKRPNWNLIQLTALAQELQLSLQFVQQPVPIVDPFRRIDPPSIVSVHVGDKIFTGEGNNFNAAKNMAVMVALKAMLKVKQELDLAKMVQAGADAEQNALDADNKSPISIVHEMAMKRGRTVQFEILKEEGPPHMKVFTVKCKVGEELETQGEGPTKQAAKKASSEYMIAKLKEIPITVPQIGQGVSLKAMQRGLMRQKQQKKKTSIPVVKDLDKQAVSPISRLIQIAHVKKYKEPEFTLISTGTETNVENFLKQITERDRRMLRKKKPVFTIEVTVGPHTCRGTGPNKKAAKKAAAEAAVIALGYPPTEGAGDDATDSSGGGGDGNISDQAPTSPPAASSGGRSSSGKKVGGHSDSGKTVKLAGARQIAPGIIILKSENSGGSTSSAEVAQEMKKVNNLMAPAPAASNREGIDKLAYLSKLLEISVSYSDFPKKNEYLSVVSLTTNPPHVAHGCGKSLEEAQNAAALKILEELSTMDLDSVTAAAEKTSE